jgi:hypothetical protein
LNIADEKVFLYGMMKDITEERRKLTDQYFSLKERVDALNKLEEKGIGELSTKGFIDLFNDTETQQKIANMHREVQHAVARREEKQLQAPRYDQIAATLERGAEDRAARAKAEVEKRDRIIAWEKKERELAEQEEQALIDQALQESQQVAMRLEEENAAKKSDYVAPVENVVPKALVEETKDKEPRPVGRPKGQENTVRKMSGLKTKEAIFFITNILKEAGRPVKADDIYKELLRISAYEIEKKNFTGNIFNRVLKQEPRIERVSPGYYQYNKNKGV